MFTQVMAAIAICKGDPTLALQKLMESADPHINLVEKLSFAELA